MLALEQALQQIAGPTPRLAGMPAVFLQLLLHGSKDRGLHNGGDRKMNPVSGRDIIV
jgi:hypothetical protein